MMYNKSRKPIILVNSTKEYNELVKDNYAHYIIKGEDKLLKFTNCGLVLEDIVKQTTEKYNFNNNMELTINTTNNFSKFIIKIENKEIIIPFDIENSDKIIQMYSILNAILRVCKFIDKFNNNIGVKSLVLQTVESDKELDKDNYLNVIVENHKLGTDKINYNFYYVYEKYLGGQ